MTDRNLHGRVTDEAYEGWQDYASRHGVSVSALMEAVGLILGEYPELIWEQIAKQARLIDAQRRSRRGD